MAWPLTSIFVRFTGTDGIDGIYEVPFTYYHPGAWPVVGEWWEWEVTVGEVWIKITVGNNHNPEPGIWSTAVRTKLSGVNKFYQIITDLDFDPPTYGAAAYYEEKLESDPIYGVGFGAVGLGKSSNPFPETESTGNTICLPRLTWEIFGESTE